MSEIERKSISHLIDELITADIKTFLAQDKIGDADDKVALAAARSAQANNKRRCELMRAIDVRLGSADTAPTSKTY